MKYRERKVIMSMWGMEDDLNGLDGYEGWKGGEMEWVGVVKSWE